MRCLKPIYIYAPVYKMKDGKFQTVDEKIAVPCGKCEACQSRRRTEWVKRLKEEAKVSVNPLFVTLTYAPHHLPYKYIKEIDAYVPVPSKDDIQKFIKRLRKQVPAKLRYFLVAEYSPEKLRPHYHMILFNYPKQLNYDKIINAWGKGLVHIAPSSGAAISYTCKYCLKPSTHPKYLPYLRTMSSSRPGIGYSYIENANIFEWHNGEKLRDYYYEKNEKTGKTHKIGLPRYYKNKLFDEYQRRELAYENRKNYANSLFKKYGYVPSFPSVISHPIGDSKLIKWQIQQEEREIDGYIPLENDEFGNPCIISKKFNVQELRKILKFVDDYNFRSKKKSKQTLDK